MARRAALLLFLLPCTALAQTATNVVVSSPVRLSRADCAGTTTTKTVTWTWSGITTTPTAGDIYRFAAYAPGTSCPTTAPIAGATAIVGNDVTTGTVLQTQTIDVSRIITAATPSCTAATDQLLNICVYYLPVTVGQVQVLWQGVLNFQTAIPPAPSVTKVSPGDGQLTVVVAAGTTDASYTATEGVTYFVYCTAGGNTSTGGPGNVGSNITCGGLTNGTTYTVTAAAQSVAGNLGPVSTPYGGPASDTTPQPFQDFWSIYKDVGGQETGGCTTAGAGALLPLGGLLALLALRRRRS